MTPALGEAAIKLARKGLRVFPVIRADKKPAIADNLSSPPSMKRSSALGGARSTGTLASRAARARAFGSSTPTGLNMKLGSASVRPNMGHCRRRSRAITGGGAASLFPMAERGGHPQRPGPRRLSRCARQAVTF